MEIYVLTSGSSCQIQDEVIHKALKRIINQVYKLLPLRQQGTDWIKPLETIVEQLIGMKRLINGQDDLFFLILCKLEGLFELTLKEDMPLYRRIIFQSLSLLNSLDGQIC